MTRSSAYRACPPPTELEAQFLLLLRTQAPGLSPPIREYRFDAAEKPRRWRFDFAWVAHRVAVEIEGRGHQKENRYASDIEKYNAAAIQGWLVLRITRRELDDLSAVALVEQALASRERGA